MSLQAGNNSKSATTTIIDREVSLKCLSSIKYHEKNGFDGLNFFILAGVYTFWYAFVILKMKL